MSSTTKWFSVTNPNPNGNELFKVEDNKVTVTPSTECVLPKDIKFVDPNDPNGTEVPLQLDNISLDKLDTDFQNANGQNVLDIRNGTDSLLKIDNTNDQINVGSSNKPIKQFNTGSVEIKTLGIDENTLGDPEVKTFDILNIIDENDNNILKLDRAFSKSNSVITKSNKIVFDGGLEVNSLSTSGGNLISSDILLFPTRTRVYQPLNNGNRQTAFMVGLTSTNLNSGPIFVNQEANSQFYGDLTVGNPSVQDPNVPNDPNQTIAKNYATTLNGTLTVTGVSTLDSASITNNATVGGTLTITGASTLDSASVTNNATIGGTLTVTGASTLDSASVTNNATVGGTLGVTGNTTLSGTLGVSGLSTLDSASVTNNATVGGTLGVTGNTTLSGTLGVSGLSTLDSASVTNNATVGGTLTVTGASMLDSASVTNNATVGGTLGVTGASTLDSASVTNNATIGGTLGVTGNTTLNGTLGVSGLSTLNSASVTNNATVGGTLGVTGNTTLSGTLGVSGLSTLDSASVTNNATVGGTLGVTGNTTLNGDLSYSEKILKGTSFGILNTDQAFDLVIRDPNQSRSSRIVLRQDNDNGDPNNFGLAGGVIQGVLGGGLNGIKLSSISDEFQSGANYNSTNGLFVNADGCMGINTINVKSNNLSESLIISPGPNQDFSSLRLQINRNANPFNGPPNGQINNTRLVFDAGFSEDNSLSGTARIDSTKFVMKSTFSTDYDNVVNPPTDLKGKEDFLKMERLVSGLGQNDIVIIGNNNGVSTPGFIGIGKINPQVKLDVDGSVQASGFITSSDKRIKTNEKVIDDQKALNFIENVQPKSFEYINKNISERVNYGFIAQDLESIDPLMVKEMKNFISNIMKKATIKLLEKPSFENVKDENTKEILNKEWESLMEKKENHSGEITMCKHMTQFSLHYEIDWEGANEIEENEIKILARYDKNDSRLELKLTRNKETGKYEFEDNVFVCGDYLFVEGTYVEDFKTINAMSILSNTVASTKLIHKENKQLKTELSKAVQLIQELSSRVEQLEQQNVP